VPRAPASRRCESETSGLLGSRRIASLELCDVVAAEVITKDGQ
jgi:hypothetical protein